MKNKILFAVLMVLAFSLVGCGKSNTGNENVEGDNNGKSNGYEIALVTDVGSIDDKSFNQGSWEGIEQYAEENDVTYKYYKPTEQSDEAISTSINLAIKGGAKVVVCPGYFFEVPLFTLQEQYPDVTFILIDAQPNDGNQENTTYHTAENVKAIFYAEEQAGFLAGYAAVKDGYKNLGFMGGIALPAVVRYGYGFVQGAEYAANELGLANDSISIKYTYVGNFDASPENMALASSWYNEGVEVIFACGGSAGNSVMKAAETANAKVIGVDVDQSSESNTVITSAMKNISKSVYDSLVEYYKGSFKGGEVVTLNASTKSVQLPMETSQFTTFSQDDYDTIYSKIVDGTVEIKGNEDFDSASSIDTKAVVVSVVQ